MIKHTPATWALILCSLTLTACSQVGSSSQEITKFGSQNKSIKEDSTLVVPPSLKMPTSNPTKQGSSSNNKPSTKQVQTPAPRKQTVARKSSQSKKDYYVVVGTYPSMQEAMDTFVRLSSIGLPNSTMETRMTKAGQRLHMVRLGPFRDQAKIDKVKDSLLSDGLSQFKVVEN